MKQFLNRNSTVFIVIILLIAAYAYKQPLEGTIERIRTIRNISSPCVRPIEYSIGEFDPQFGLSKKQFMAVLSRAEATWEGPTGKNLFQYSDQGEVKVNLIYDYRQQATEDLATLGVGIRSDKATYDGLKAQYLALVTAYDAAKIEQQQLISSYNKSKDAYEAEVDRWNSKGGAPPAEYGRLEQERRELDSKAGTINQKTTTLNAQADEINRTVNTLNRIAHELNLQVSTFNTIGATTGREFDEGEYIQDANGTRINVYQFASQEKLYRLLAHEFGHVLGMDHVDDPNAIMYRLNESSSSKPTDDDLAELNKICSEE